MLVQPPTQQYLDTLLLYYEEEIMGEAYFRALSKRFSEPDRVFKMELMAQVERHAANSVLPLVQKYKLTPRTDAELHAIELDGIEDVTSDWTALIAEMQRSFPDYIPEFHALEAMGPEADMPRLQFFTDHEVAAIEFLDLEVQNRESVMPMLAYLKADPDPALSR